MTKKLLASAAALALSTAVLAGPAQAQASVGSHAKSAACSSTVVGGADISSATLNAPSNAPYRTGPGENYCSYGNRTGSANVYCTRTSSAGNLWYRAQDKSSGVLGWIWAGNVSSVSTEPDVDGAAVSPTVSIARSASTLFAAAMD